MSTDLKIHDKDTLKPRAPGEPIADMVAADPGLSVYAFADMSGAVEFAKVMAQAGPMLPKHAQGQVGVCLAIVYRANHWGIDPFGLAMESYQVKADAPITYQASVYKAVAINNGINFEYTYTGETHFTAAAATSAKGNQVAGQTAAGTRQVTVRAEVAGEMREYISPMLKDIKVKNSPLWHNDPDQQLGAYGARSWMRKYRPDLMMGAMSVDEAQDASPMRNVTPTAATGGWAAEARQARGEVMSDEAEVKVKEHPEAESIDDADFVQSEADPELSGHWTDDADANEGFPGSDEWEAGVAAFQSDSPRTDCPHEGDLEAANEWLGGWDGAKVAIEWLGGWDGAKVAIE